MFDFAENPNTGFDLSIHKYLGMLFCVFQNVKDEILLKATLMSFI